MDPTSSPPDLDAPTVAGFADEGSVHDKGTRATHGFGINVASLGSLVGVTWGDFQLGKLLGRGGMGAVYRGRQLSLDREVAIKVLPPELAERDELRERFLREARAIAQVASPHIVQVYHAGSFAGWYFYAMELIDGPDLGRRLRDGWRPTPAEARQLVLQAARGLSVAARSGIVHRDIKPANMLITADGCLKVTDFGLVRRAGDQELTTNGQIMGTAAYLSPEQALGRTCDARSDLYALGIVLYELLTGSPPFVADAPAAVIYQHLHASPGPLEGRTPPIGAATIAICRKLLEKEAAARYQTAADLCRDLEAASGGRSLRFAVAERAPRWPWVAGAVAVMLALGAAWFFHDRSERQRQAEAEAAERRALIAEAQLEAQAEARAERERLAAEAEARRHDAHGRFTDLPVPGAAFRLRELPPGAVVVGSPDDEADRSDSEVRAEVRFSRTFWIGDSEITQAQWRAVIGSPPEQAFPGDDLPVTGVTRVEAAAFCARLAVMLPGLAARLPTEAEWERAAHAGSEGPWAGGRALETQAWFAGNSGKRTHPVRQFPPNPWGLHDVHGNVAEWTADAYADRTAKPQVDPGPVAGDGKVVVKGGAWDDDPEDCRIARRESARSASKRIGFRIVVTALPPALR